MSAIQGKIEAVIGGVLGVIEVGGELTVSLRMGFNVTYDELFQLSQELGTTDICLVSDAGSQSEVTFDGPSLELRIRGWK